MSTETFTREQALAHARKWIDDQIDPPPDHRTFFQRRWLMEELAARCVAEALQQGGDEWALNERLDAAYEIISQIQLYTRPHRILDAMWASRASDDSKEQAKAAMAENVVWKRIDPQRAFEEGLDSEHMPRSTRTA